MLTKEQFKQLYDKGLSVQQIRDFEAGKTPQTMQPQEKGFLRTLVEDPIKTLLVKPAARTTEALGRMGVFGKQAQTGYEQMANETQNYGGIQIEPQKGFDNGGLSQIVGDAAKTTSYLYGGGAGTQAVKTGLKGQIIQGALQGSKAGAIGGGTYSFGEAIQDAENQASDIAFKTLFGTAAGGVTGGILGAATPLVVNGMNTVKTYKNIEELENKLYQSNKDIFKPTPTQTAEWSRQKVDPLRTFTREFGPEAISSSGDKLQLDDFISQTEARYKAGSEGFNTILRNSPEVMSIDKARRSAIHEIYSSDLKPTLKQQALEKIDIEFNAIKAEARQRGLLLGDDNIPVWYGDNLKDGFWGATKNFGSEESTVANSVNKNIGFAFKEGIENAVTDVNVKNYNKKLQELIVLKDFLESKNGRVPGSGGKMARYTARIVGGSAGFGGGPVGSVVGSLTADKVAQAMINPEARTWILRKQLEKLSTQERKSLQQEAEQIIQQMMQKRAETLRLPPPSYIPMGGKILGEGENYVRTIPAQYGQRDMLPPPKSIQLPGEGIMRGQQNIK